MNTTLILGSIIVTLALVFYTITIFAEQKLKSITKRIFRTQSIGLFLDVTATVCMIIGSTNTPFTTHGFIGYSALAVMIVKTIWMMGFIRKNHLNTAVSKSLHIYSWIAYGWWVVAFITGGIIAAT
jgi:uncharacterized repeat protein (TIGR03987 family)